MPTPEIPPRFRTLHVTTIFTIGAVGVRAMLTRGSASSLRLAVGLVVYFLCEFPWNGVAGAPTMAVDRA
jgi:hypothetical protein